MKPHPLIGKIIKHGNEQYLIIAAPRQFTRQSWMIYTGIQNLMVMPTNVASMQVASPGEDYRPLTLKDLEP